VALDDDAALIELTADFAKREIDPHVAQYDQAETLPRDLLAKMADLGLFGGVVAKAYGGAGLSFRTYTRVIETLSQSCNAMGCLASMPSGLVGAAIARFGTVEQKHRWLTPLAQGEIFGAAGVTEPDTGTDVGAMRTTYRRDGDEFVLSGAKAWITNINIASFFVTFATHDRSLGRRGVTAFLLPAGAAGITVRPYTNKLGFRPLCTGDLVFDEVRVGSDALLGAEGDGFRVAMTAVEHGRLGVAARAVGVAQACLDETREYALHRETFGTMIANYQLVQSKITDMAVGVETARLLVGAAADDLQRGNRARRLTSMAKMHASDVAFRSAAEAVQVHGAAGISPDFKVGRLLRDAKVLQIVEGSNDIHRALIAELELGLRSE
jgi:alkylation response protein AidB-like acyl-CoA dehydrogenase